MQQIDVQNAVGRTTYPGRGIVLGMSEDGAHAVIGYFIMGRSVNSRNRVFVADGDGLRTQAHDPAKVADPSLIIYAPVRVAGKHTVVTNGDQTDTICEHLNAGSDFAAALRARTFEPDAPNFTPRVSGMVTLCGAKVRFDMAILKSDMGDSARCLRQFFEYEAMYPGEGRFLHTYQGDGEPLPSFEGEPEPVSLRGGIDQVTGDIWNGLNADNRVSLFVRFIRLSDGAHEDRIVNRHA